MASGSGELSIQDLDSSVIQVTTYLCNLGAERSSFTPQQRDQHIEQRIKMDMSHTHQIQQHQTAGHHQQMQDMGHQQGQHESQHVDQQQGHVVQNQQQGQRQEWLRSYGLSLSTVQTLMDNGFCNAQLFANLELSDIPIMNVH